MRMCKRQHWPPSVSHSSIPSRSDFGRALVLCLSFFWSEIHISETHSFRSFGLQVDGYALRTASKRMQADRVLSSAPHRSSYKFPMMFSDSLSIKPKICEEIVLAAVKQNGKACNLTRSATLHVSLIADVVRQTVYVPSLCALNANAPNTIQYPQRPNPPVWCPGVGVGVCPWVAAKGSRGAQGKIEEQAVLFSPKGCALWVLPPGRWYELDSGGIEWRFRTGCSWKVLARLKGSAWFSTLVLKVRELGSERFQKVPKSSGSKFARFWRVAAVEQWHGTSLLGIPPVFIDSLHCYQRNGMKCQGCAGSGPSEWQGRTLSWLPCWCQRSAELWGHELGTFWHFMLPRHWYSPMKPWRMTKRLCQWYFLQTAKWFDQKNCLSTEFC